MVQEVLKRDLSFMETLLRKVKLSLVGCQLCQLFPFLLAAGFLGQPIGSVQVAKLDSQVKPVDDSQSHPKS